MSELSVKVAREHVLYRCTEDGGTGVFGQPLNAYVGYECECGWTTGDATATSLHLADVTEAAVRETIAAERLTWLAGAVREAVSNAPGRSSEVNLATAYWDGYRAAGHEIADLIEEPAFAARIARGES